MKKRITVSCNCNLFPDLQTPCCDMLKQMLNDCYVRLNYIPDMNMYGIRFVGVNATQGFYYCPWCGKKLPEIQKRKE